MNREEFNKLSEIAQIEYFNNELKNENNNFNAICREIGVSKNTILGRFKNNGFVPAKEGQRITLFCKENEVDNVKLISKEEKKKQNFNDLYDIKNILKRIELLENEISLLKDAKLIKSNNNFINSYTNTISRTFKIDKEVYEELDKFMSEFDMYKKQDIISSLLKFALTNIR